MDASLSLLRPLLQLFLSLSIFLISHSVYSMEDEDNWEILKIMDVEIAHENSENESSGPPLKKQRIDCFPSESSSSETSSSDSEESLEKSLSSGSENTNSDSEEYSSNDSDGSSSEENIVIKRDGKMHVLSIKDIPEELIRFAIKNREFEKPPKEIPIKKSTLHNQLILNKLPVGVWRLIFECCFPRDYLSINLVSKTFREIVHSIMSLMPPVNMDPQPWPYNHGRGSMNEREEDYKFRKYLYDLRFATILFNFSNLLSLDLESNGIILDPYISRFKNLLDLNLKENDLITDSLVKRMTQLRRLNLWGNKKISSESVSLLRNLTDLDLTRNNLITDECLIRLPQIQKLNLAQNDLVTDQCLLKLITLKSLNLGWNNKITKECLAQLTQLTELFLYMNWQGMDFAIQHLTNLKKLEIRDQLGMGKYAGQLTRLTQLETLVVVEELGMGSEWFSRLPNLTKLTFGPNSYYSTDELDNLCLQRLTTLKTLMLGNKKITPQSIECLPNLTYLELAHLDQRDQQYMIEKLSHLTNLNILEDRAISDNVYYEGCFVKY